VQKAPVRVGLAGALRFAQAAEQEDSEQRRGRFDDETHAVGGRRSRPGGDKIGQQEPVTSACPYRLTCARRDRIAPAPCLWGFAGC